MFTKKSKNQKRGHIHDRIRFKNPDVDQQTVYGNAEAHVIDTTAGRVIFNQIWPAKLGSETDS